jgi:hypothetical protein
MRRSAGALLPVVVVGLFASTAGAQQRPAKALAAPIAEFAEPFSGPLQLLELRDGRVLVHDTKEKRLSLVDFTGAAMTDAAREGSGPTEFRSALAILRAPGDTAWLYDIVQMRILVLTPDGKPVRTQPMMKQGDPMAMMNMAVIRELDARGRAFGEVRGMSFAEGTLKMADSVAIVRVLDGKVDTLAKSRSHVSAPTISPQKITMRAPGFPPVDAWGAFPDGRVMLIRGERYVPEIHLADGTRRTAAAVPFPRVVVTAADKAKMMADSRKAMEEAMSMGRAMAGGQPMPEFEILEPAEWQATKPPLKGGAIHVDPKNRAWVQVLEAGDPVGDRYDLLDAEGRWVDAVRLPKDVALLGFGKGVVYGARKDADDLLWLQRYALP